MSCHTAAMTTGIRTEVDLADWPQPLQQAVASVAADLGQPRRLGVAFSGGVDSSVLLALAIAVLGAPRVVAVVGVSASLATRERDEARALAQDLGATVVELPTAEGQRVDYRRNGPDRCRYCKDELFTRIEADLAAQLGLSAIAYGENADDAARLDRPGSLAARDHGVLAPLAAAGLGKAQVRQIARLLGLPNADKPASPCLASRIPHGREVTATALGQIEAAEAGLHDLGLREFRVRHHGQLARVELGEIDQTRAQESHLRAQILATVAAAGFADVVIDPAGLQSGAFTLRALSQVGHD